MRHPFYRGGWHENLPALLVFHVIISHTKQSLQYFPSSSDFPHCWVTLSYIAQYSPLPLSIEIRAVSQSPCGCTTFLVQLSMSGLVSSFLTNFLILPTAFLKLIPHFMVSKFPSLSYAFKILPRWLYSP